MAGPYIIKALGHLGASLAWLSLEINTILENNQEENKIANHWHSYSQVTDKRVGKRFPQQHSLNSWGMIEILLWGWG